MPKQKAIIIHAKTLISDSKALSDRWVVIEDGVSLRSLGSD